MFGFKIILSVEHKRLLSIEKEFLRVNKELEKANSELNQLRRQVPQRDSGGKFCKK